MLVTTRTDGRPREPELRRAVAQATAADMLGSVEMVEADFARLQLDLRVRVGGDRVPRVATVFFVSIYGLTAIAGLMLAFAEGNPFPEILTPALAIVAYVLTDRTRKLFTPRAFGPTRWASLAFLYAGYQMYRSRPIELRLLAGAHLVVYLTWIVLFQEKHLPQYWWMCALSVLQVAIGSILTISSSYGGMLLGIHVRLDLDAVGLFAVPGPFAIWPIERAVGDARPHGAGEPPGRWAAARMAARGEPGAGALAAAQHGPRHDAARPR